MPKCRAQHFLWVIPNFEIEFKLKKNYKVYENFRQLYGLGLEAESCKNKVNVLLEQQPTFPGVEARTNWQGATCHNLTILLTSQNENLAEMCSSRRKYINF